MKLKIFGCNETFYVLYKTDPKHYYLRKMPEGYSGKFSIYIEELADISSNDLMISNVENIKKMLTERMEQYAHLKIVSELNGTVYTSGQFLEKYGKS